MTKQTHSIDIIDILSYDNGYAAGYAEGESHARECFEQEQLHAQRRRRRRSDWPKRQRFHGLCIILISAIEAFAVHSVIPAVIGVPFGLVFLFYRHRILY